jgi:homoserine kinase
VLVTRDGWRFSARPLDCARLQAIFVLPEIQFGTRESRGALPKDVPLADAVFNIGKSLQTAEALRKGDIQALAAAIQDKLHQPYRLPLIPGAAEALEAARKAGAAAALSGAGPGLIAFTEEGREKAVSEAMQAAFEGRGVKTKEYLLKSAESGATVKSS